MEARGHLRRGIGVRNPVDESVGAGAGQWQQVLRAGSSGHGRPQPNANSDSGNVRLVFKRDLIQSDLYGSSVRSEFYLRIFCRQGPHGEVSSARSVPGD